MLQEMFLSHCLFLQVMKCVVEALADVLSRPHPIPVSQECLVILKTGEPLGNSSLIPQ